MPKGVRLVRGSLSGRVYAVTRWKVRPGAAPGEWESVEKFDVTDDYNALRETEVTDADTEAG